MQLVWQLSTAATQSVWSIARIDRSNDICKLLKLWRRRGKEGAVFGSDIEEVRARWDRCSKCDLCSSARAVDARSASEKRDSSFNAAHIMIAVTALRKRKRCMMLEIQVTLGQELEQLLGCFEHV